MPGHGHRVFIEIPRAATPPPLSYRPRSPRSPQRSPPRSPRHVQFRRHSLSLEDRPAFISRDDLDTMQEREHGLVAANDSLLRHNHLLKVQLQAKEKALREQASWVEQLEMENHELRRSLERSGGSDADARREARDAARDAKTIRELRRQNARLEADNDSLKGRVRELLRSVKDATDDRVRLLRDEVLTLKKQIVEWRRRYDDADRRLIRMRENLDGHIEENERLASENERLRRNLDDRSRRRGVY